MFFQCDPFEHSRFLRYFFSLKILVLAGIKDMKRPVEKVSLFQSLALTGTGEYTGQHDLVTGINTASKDIVSTSMPLASVTSGEYSKAAHPAHWL